MVNRRLPSHADFRSRVQPDSSPPVAPVEQDTQPAEQDTQQEKGQRSGSPNRSRGRPPVPPHVNLFAASCPGESHGGYRLYRQATDPLLALPPRALRACAFTGRRTSRRTRPPQPPPHVPMEWRRRSPTGRTPMDPLRHAESDDGRSRGAHDRFVRLLLAPHALMGCSTRTWPRIDHSGTGLPMFRQPYPSDLTDAP